MEKDFTWEWLQPISKEIFEAKYMLHGEKDIVDVFSQVAKEISSVEKTKELKSKYEEMFFDELVHGRLIPAGRILANARPDSKMKNYNNCFTIGVQDDLQSIYSSLKEDAIISKAGGGVGFNSSKIRPKGSPLSKGGEASGVISFLKVFDASAKIIMTGGFRRSAHITLLDVSHPDIEEFITCKKGETNNNLTQFNISVIITDDFIKAVENDEDWDLIYNGKVYKTVKAKYLYDLLTKNAYEHNEPGIFNIDTVEKYNNGYWAFKLDAVNPCAELCMPEYSLCCLSSINLTKFVKDPFSDNPSVDWDAMEKTIKTGVRFLDNVLDATEYPLKKIEDNSKQWRRIGLGFTGLGDFFAMMKIKYGSKESKLLSFKIAKFFRDTSYSASSELAKEKGSFPMYDKDKIQGSKFIKKLPTKIKKQIKKNGLRNIGLNTVAPTGTISFSIGQNCSSGIEPIFSTKYNRNIRTGNGDETRQETVYDFAALEYQRLTGEKTIPDYFVTTKDIAMTDSVDIQAIFQKYIDHSISKTLNLPEGTSFEEYKDIFLYAYKKGLKGFTSFNPSGSMKGVLEYENKETKEVGFIKRTEAPKRPDSLDCDIHEIKVSGERFIILVGKYNGSLYEIFVTKDIENSINMEKHKTGKIIKVSKGVYDLSVINGETKTIIKNIGSTFDSKMGTLARFISMSLRHGTPLQFIVTQLAKDKNFLGFERAVSRVLKKYIKDGEKVKTSDVCPECQDQLIYKDGCMSCQSCGWSKCG